MSLSAVHVGPLEIGLLAGGAAALVAVVAVRMSTRYGLPSLLIYLAIGLALGEEGIGIRFQDPTTAHDLGLAALVVILAEGGLTTRWSEVRPVLPLAGLLASVGVATTIGVVGFAAHLLLGLDTRLALLYGAVLASTDAAAVFSVLRNVRLRHHLGPLLEAESGTNDPLAVLAVTALATTGFPTGWSLPLVLVQQLVLGAVVGAVVGEGGVRLLRAQALPASGLYPLTVAALIALAYGGASVLGASGFLAVYLSALRLGNAELPHRAAVTAFTEGLAWTAQIGVFVLLGLLASPSRLSSAVGPALLIGAVLLLVARPLSVALCATPLRVPWRQQALISWAGLRRAVPVVLATIPLQAALPGATRLFDVVFVLVVLFTLVQAPALAPLARALGLATRDPIAELDLEIAPLATAEAELLSLTISATSRLHGLQPWQLRLPELGSLLPLVVRDGTPLVPDENTWLQHGDELLVVCRRTTRRATIRRLANLSAQGGLAPWEPAPR
jgi:cell volume regulation protein A